jgi:hypothetical protein
MLGYPIEGFPVFLDFLPEKTVLPISCAGDSTLSIIQCNTIQYCYLNSAFPGYPAHVNKRLDSNPLSWWECTSHPFGDKKTKKI